MVSEYLKQTRSISELQSIIDSDRKTAAALAEATFRHDVNAAITSITEINAVATARVSADTQVASAKMLIDAEVVATRLMADAQIAIAEYKKYVENQSSAVPAEVVSGMIKQIGEKHTAQLSQQAKTSIEVIQRDAQEAIAKLKDIAATAIRDIHGISASITADVDSAATTAAEKLRDFRQEPHNLEETAQEAEEAALQIEAAAARASLELQTTVYAALENIHKSTDEACAIIKSAANTATEKIETAREKALATIRTVLEFHKE